VAHLQNATDGDLFLYPGFILYRVADETFSVIDFHDVKIVADSIRFHEPEKVPKDSKVIGQTWARQTRMAVGTKGSRTTFKFQSCNTLRFSVSRASTVYVKNFTSRIPSGWIASLRNGMRLFPHLELRHSKRFSKR